MKSGGYIKQRAFTLIEVLIAATIFAGVLISSLVIFSTVNATNKVTNSSRDVAYAGYTFVESVAELARYATPSRQDDGSLGCPPGIGVGGSYGNGTPIPQFPITVCQTGLVYDSNSHRLGINLLNATVPTRVYIVYQLTLTPRETTITRRGVDYQLYDPVLVKYQSYSGTPPTNDLIYYEETATVDQLIPDNVVILVPVNEEPFTLQTGAVRGATETIGGAEDLSLALAAAGEVPAGLLSLNLTFANDTELNHPDATAIFPFQTAVTTRTLTSRFNE